MALLFIRWYFEISDKVNFKRETRLQFENAESFWHACDLTLKDIWFHRFYWTVRWQTETKIYVKMHSSHSREWLFECYDMLSLRQFLIRSY